MKTKWWIYLLMGVADVEANYTVVKAYQFTTLTSIQVCATQQVSPVIIFVYHVIYRFLVMIVPCNVFVSRTFSWFQSLNHSKLQKLSKSL